MDKKINLANMLLKMHIDQDNEKGSLSLWRTHDNVLYIAAELSDNWMVVMTNHDFIKGNHGLFGKIYELANDFIDLIQKEKAKSGAVIDFSDLDNDLP